MNDAFYQVLTVLAEAFEDLTIGYSIGGSIASTTYGMPRSTMDVDVVAERERSHVPPLVARLTPLGYLDTGSIYAAIAGRRSFNLIPLQGPAKIDVFLPQDRPFDHAIFTRVRYVDLDPRATRPFALPSPEDIILLKLEWFEQTNRQSRHQWPDVIGVLQGQHDQLDWAYLQRWAAVLGLTALLTQARTEAGV